MSSNNRANNSLYICNEMLQNVVIMTDENGKNELDTLPKFKYNQRLLNRCINNIKKDSVLINDQIHTDCIVVVDEHSNNVLKSKDEISNKNAHVENNLFIEMLKQVHVDKEPANIEEFLLKKREFLQTKLKTARYFFNMKLFIKACDLYKEVLTILKTDTYPDEFMLKDADILAIKFAYALSKMAICKTEELQSATKILTTLKTEHGDEFPTLYYYLARCLFLLEKYQDAKDVIDSGQKILKGIEFLSELNWPGSDVKMIVRTEKPLLEENIQTLFKECSEFRLPDIKCIFLQCENKNIFFDSPCFNGYVTVKCSNKCNFTYHRNCWKLKLKADCVKKPSYFLGCVCGTDDCGGTINEILIYDENLHLNTFIIPKIVNSSDKHEEKFFTASNKITKKPKIISDTLNKNISKKNGEKSATNEYVSKIENKPTFNLNAKEYVPLTLNTSADDANDANKNIPPIINNNAENEERVNLFDVVPKVEVNDEPYILSFNRDEPIATINYSEEDKIPIDFKSAIDNDINKKINEETQTDTAVFAIMLNSTEIAKLKKELTMLQSQLFQSEEDYNNLLAQNNLLQRHLKEASAKPNKCDNCRKLENVIMKKDSETSDALMQLKQSEQNNSDLTSKLKELQNAMKLELHEKQVKVEYNENLLKKNDVLQGRIDDLLSKMKLMSQQHAYVVQHDNMNLRKVMFDQIGCIRHAYASYFDLYENKSKHMLWELEDIKALSTSETLPSLAEVEENIVAWKNTLDNSVKSRYMMNGFYEHLFRQFSNDPNNGFPMPVAMSFPSFIVEPPNIIVRHFKSLIIVNKKLEQELTKHMNSFYKMMSTPYPGVFPQKNSDILNVPVTTIATTTPAAAATAAATATATTFARNQTVHSSVLQNNTSENISELVQCNKTKNEITAHSSKWDSANVANSKVTNMYDNLVATVTPIGPTSRKITKQSLFNDNITSTNDEMTTSSRKENCPIDATAKCDSIPLGTIPKNKVSPFIDTFKRNSSIPNPIKSKPNVIGPETLVNKLHEKLPLVPIDLISKAVNLLRERSGGLTGKDSKQIIAEVKHILKEIAITEKCLRKSKELPPEKPVKTWKQVNNGVHWNNEDPDVNCTICFEFMSPEKRIKLRCQHIFHQTCIKLWLQNDSICPICRSFATLDDEFPPLK